MSMETIKKLAENAAVQLETYPVISGKEKVKRIIKKNLLGQKIAPIDRYSWPNALLGEGLLEAFEVTFEKSYLDAVIKHLEQWKKDGLQIHYVDNLMNGSLALCIEELINGKAAEFYSESEKQRTVMLCQQITEKCADWVRKAKKTPDGVLAYRTQHASWLFADTVGMVCPFLCRYGIQKNDEQLLQLGILQIQNYLKYGMDRRTGLPYHGYDETNQIKYGIIGWGRACGWVMKGMAESILWIPSKMREKRQLKQAFWNMKDSVSKYQRRDGGFSWQVQAAEGPVDVSAGAMIGNALWAVSQKGETKQATLTTLEQLSDSFLISVTGGEVHNCSGECHGFAQYPQVYGSYPWGTGSVLRYLALKERLEADMRMSVSTAALNNSAKAVSALSAAEEDAADVPKEKNQNKQGKNKQKKERVPVELRENEKAESSMTDNDVNDGEKQDKKRKVTEKSEKSENKENIQTANGGGNEISDKPKKKPHHRKKRKPANKEAATVNNASETMEGNV